MNDLNLSFKPPELLAIEYAPTGLKAGLSILLAFDSKMADIVENSREPMIAQMKIAWWNDVIVKHPSQRPRGEPMIAALVRFDSEQLNLSVQKLLDGWSILAAHERWDADLLTEFKQCRSEAIFATYAKWVGSDVDVRKFGSYWAVADLRRRFGDRVPESCLPDIIKWKTSRALRPLSILALSVAKPTGVQMLWHALTGR